MRESLREFTVLASGVFVPYLAFVIYGSLVPLEFRPLPWEQAWQRFQDIPYLQLGLESRADWVANGVLYVPLGALLAVNFSGVGARLRLNAGVPARLFAERTGLPMSTIDAAVRRAEERGLLAGDPGRIVATDLGRRFLSDLQSLFQPLEALLQRREGHAEGVVLPLKPGRADPQPCPGRRRARRALSPA